MPTFLHTADIHLDTAFSAHFDAEQAKLRRGEMLRCVSDLIDCAKGVDLFLISGDLFDSPFVSAETTSFLKRRFAEIPDTHIFICAGNHDPYTPKSIYAKEEFSKNVHIFKGEWDCVELPDIKTRVYGASFTSDGSHYAKELPRIDKVDGVTDIILMHGELSSSGSDSIYNPIDKAFIEGCNADYLALGHIHKRTDILRYGKTYFAYPGPPEGRGFDECGDMGFYIGKIEGGVVSAEFKRSCIRRLYKMEIDISGASDSIEALDKVKTEAFKSGCDSDMYKITLTGRVSADVVSFDVVENEFKSLVYYVEMYNEVKADYDIDEISRQNTLCGEFVRRMQSHLSEAYGEDKLIAEEALVLGIDALVGGDTL